MSTPTVSIITITYNAERELPATMHSVSSQTYLNYEHLIIDGASKDSTLTVANELRTSRTRILSEPDKGLYDAMNKGLHLAKGDFVLFLNAGDTFASEATLNHMAHYCDKRHDIIYGDTDIIDSKGNIIGHRHLSAPEILTHESFSRGMLICHQAFMVRRSIAPDYDLTYRFSADYDWTVKCIERTKPDRCVNVHEVVIYYLSDGMTDRNKWASLKERFRIMCRHYGTSTTIGRHLSFIPRVVARKLSHK